MGDWKSSLRDKTIKYRSSVLLIFFLGIILAVSSVIVYYALLENAQDMGQQIAYDYFADEERNLDVYKNIIQLGSQYIDDMEKRGEDSKAISEWVRDYLDKTKTITGANSVVPYVVIKGKVISEEEGAENYQLEEAKWYRQALEAEGEVICTDVYPDPVTNKQIITIAQKSDRYDNVIAFHVLPENFQGDFDVEDLPERSSLFLCDSQGTMLYGKSSMKVPQSELPGYVSYVHEKIEKKELEDFNDYVYDLEKNKRAVYYTVSPDGWYYIITIPYDTLLKRFNQVFYMCLILFSIFSAVIIIAIIMKNRTDRNARRTEETIRVLENSYFALYRIDTKHGRYEMIKGSEYAHAHLEKEGEYEKLLEVLSRQMSSETYEDFAASFSTKSIRNHLQSGRNQFGGDFIRTMDGKEEWFNVLLLSDMTLNQNEGILCFRVIEDAKRRQIQQMRLLEEALQSAQQSRDSQRQFFSEMSHDMRTPMNVIIGTAERAEKSLLDSEKVSRHLKEIQDSGRQLLGLISRVLNVSKAEQRIALENKPFDLKEATEDIVKIFQYEAEEVDKNFAFSCDVKNRIVNSDSLKISQILNNLLSNALKYTDPGDSISVEIRQKEHKDCVRYQIVVTDTGIGISEKFMDQIFLPYTREHRFGAMNRSGTGLGMAIAKTIVTHMGGEISVASTLGQGTTFTVMLPLEVVEDETVISAERKTDEKEYSLEKKNILLVEDYALNMEIATELLELKGAQVVQAWNGKEAVEQFEKSEQSFFDAILMDMQMPIMNGCEAAKAIRALERGDAKKVPIVALTANTFTEDMVQTAEAGMDAHLAKPIQIDVVCRTLGQLMSERTE